MIVAPRTATVTAISDAEVLAIVGDVFTAVLAGAINPPDALGSIMGIRLSRTHPSLSI